MLLHQIWHRMNLYFSPKTPNVTGRKTKSVCTIRAPEFPFRCIRKNRYRLFKYCINGYATRKRNKFLNEHFLFYFLLLFKSFPQIYVPELIFGHLLTSSNYNDNEKKVTGGRNGYGAKLCNIFSSEFIVETADKVNGLKYTQVFRNNMSSRDKPIIKENKLGEQYTKITFTPGILFHRGLFTLYHVWCVFLGILILHLQYCFFFNSD